MTDKDKDIKKNKTEEASKVEETPEAVSEAEEAAPEAKKEDK